MPGLGTFYNTRVADLRAAQTILLNSWRTKSLPASQELTLGGIVTPMTLLLVFNLLASLSTSHGRYMLPLPANQVTISPKSCAYFVRAHSILWQEARLGTNRSVAS